LAWGQPRCSTSNRHQTDSTRCRKNRPPQVTETELRIGERIGKVRNLKGKMTTQGVMRMAIECSTFLTYESSHGQKGRLPTRRYPHASLRLSAKMHSKTVRTKMLSLVEMFVRTRSAMLRTRCSDQTRRKEKKEKRRKKKKKRKSDWRKSLDFLFFTSFTKVDRISSLRT